MVRRPRTRNVLVERATLTDVAKMAGVSRQTASRVARGGENVSAETQSRVRSAIDALGYRPDAVARALTVGSGGMIGILLYDLGRMGHAVVTVTALEEAASAAGFGLCIANIGAFEAGAFDEAVAGLQRLGCDGIVVIAPWIPDAEGIGTITHAVPMVTTSQIEGFPGPSIHVDTMPAVRMMMDHHFSLGHERIAHVAGPPDSTAAALRRRGWQEALEARGASVPEPFQGDGTSDSGYRAGIQIADLAEATAVFVASDAMALGVLHGLHERGVAIPDDISVASFDDSPVSAHTWPPLTTVGFDAREQGSRAIAALLKRISGEEVVETAPIPPTMTVRPSTAPPRVAV